MAKSLAIMLANGLEEVEFSVPFDLCYRADIDITLIAVSEEIGSSLEIIGSHQLRLQAHIRLAKFLKQAQYPDAVFLPGGMPGSKHLAKNPYLVKFLQEYALNLESQQRYLAAICAAPAYVLGKACGLLKKYTCYPGTEFVVPTELQAQKLAQPLVEDGNIITASGMGSAHLLAEALMQRLVGVAKAKEVMKAALYR